MIFNVFYSNKNTLIKNKLSLYQVASPAGGKLYRQIINKLLRHMQESIKRQLGQTGVFFGQFF